MGTTGKNRHQKSVNWQMKDACSVTMPNRKSATRLSANILNYFAAFTETRLNFRTLINYRWTDNELTLDLGIFQDVQEELLQKCRQESGNSTHIIAFFLREIGRLSLELAGIKLKWRFACLPVPHCDRQASI